VIACTMGRYCSSSSWALIVLLPLSAASRLYALRQPDPGSRRSIAGRDRRHHRSSDPGPRDLPPRPS